MKIGKWKEIIISINYGSLARQHHHDCLEGEFSSYFAILPFSALVVSLATHHYSFFFTKHGNLSLLLLLFRAMMPCFFVRDSRNQINKRREAEINKGPVLGLHIKAFLSFLASRVTVLKLEWSIKTHTQQTFLLLLLLFLFSKRVLRCVCVRHRTPSTSMRLVSSNPSP